MSTIAAQALPFRSYSSSLSLGRTTVALLQLPYTTQACNFCHSKQDANEGVASPERPQSAPFCAPRAPLGGALARG